IDEVTSKPLEGATVQLIQNKMDTVIQKKRDFVIALMLTDRKGEFTIDQLTVMGNYKLVITAVGYEKKEMKAAFELNMQAAKSGDLSSLMSGVVKDLGNIPLKPDAKELETVV